MRRQTLKDRGRVGRQAEVLCSVLGCPVDRKNPDPPVEISDWQTSGHTDQVSRQVALAMLTPSVLSLGRHTSPHQHVDIVASHGMPRERL